MSTSLLLARSGGTVYGLPSECVREIASLPDMIRLPGSADSVLGLANLRGSLFPVIDLAARVGASGGGGPERTVVVVELDHRLLGLAVDDVDEVVELEVSPLEGDRRILAGTGHSGDMVVLVVDVHELVRTTLA